ncbi:MAG: DeoR/GlpR transcriptional regulator [Christensenellaceae bacterium]|nr:DeoR/GlpR transcriptional regulator [Christensenellaceae bacterium]
MKTDRIREMQEYIVQRNSATMEELKAHFNVSMNTVRRDVNELIQRGVLDKVYGGVSVRRSDHALTPYEVRRINSEAAKTKIGRRAAEMVRDGDIIFIDSGTTTMQMIDFLQNRRELTVITNNLEVIIRALPYENINVIALPGQLRRKTNSFAGSDAVRSLQRYNIRTAFIAATGISAHGVTNSSPSEYEIKKCAAEICEEKVLLVTGEKFGVTGLMTFAPVNAFQRVITDRRPGEEYCQLLKNARAELILAD